jgi:hypothetical protein
MTTTRTPTSPAAPGDTVGGALEIIIVSYNTRALLEACIRSLEEARLPAGCRVVVVDNASTDGSAEMAETGFPWVEVLRNDRNRGFACANNIAFERGTAPFVLLLNPDTVVKPGAIEAVLAFMESASDAGGATCRLLNPDGTLQPSIFSFPSLGTNLGQLFFLDSVLCARRRRALHFRPEPFPIDYPSGAFMMVRREAAGAGPLLNPDFFMYAEEKDLALRLRERGWRTYFVPGAEIVHHGGGSTRAVAAPMFLEMQRSQAVFYTRHFRGFRRLVLLGSWWLVLASKAAASALLLPAGKSRRFGLFLRAAWAFPGFALRAARGR